MLLRAVFVRVKGIERLLQVKVKYFHTSLFRREITFHANILQLDPEKPKIGCTQAGR